jgi:hypothetical protein
MTFADVHRTIPHHHHQPEEKRTMANNSGVSMPGGISAGQPRATGPAKMTETHAILDRAYTPPATPVTTHEVARERPSIPTKG